MAMTRMNWPKTVLHLTVLTNLALNKSTRLIPIHFQRNKRYRFFQKKRANRLRKYGLLIFLHIAIGCISYRPIAAVPRTGNQLISTSYMRAVSHLRANSHATLKSSVFFSSPLTGPWVQRRSSALRACRADVTLNAWTAFVMYVWCSSLCLCYNATRQLSV